MIVSKTNQQLKNWNKLKQKKYRDESGLFLVYGPHLVEEAVKSHHAVEIITCDPEVTGTLISKELMKILSQTETMFSVMAVCKKVSNEDINSNRVLVLDDIQDPDNLGALLRSALAFGFRQVLISPKSADPYNEKSLRAAQGATFYLKIVKAEIIPDLNVLKKAGYLIISADAHEGEVPPLEIEKLILILGNEGQGIKKELLNLSDHIVKIDTQTVESLNVSVAGGILMHKWRNKSC